MKDVFKLLLIGIIISSCNHSNNNAIIKSKDTVNTTTVINTKPDTIDGYYHEYYPDGKKKMEGKYKDGNRDGDWTYFHPNGVVWSLGVYENGKRNGASSVYRNTGVIEIEGQYKDNKPSGIWKFYNDNGKLVKEVTQK